MSEKPPEDREKELLTREAELKKIIEKLQADLAAVESILGKKEEETVESTPENIKKEIENLSLEDREKITIGFYNIGFVLEKKKSEWFAESFDWISKKGDQKGTVARFTRGLRDSFKRDVDMAQKNIAAGKKAGAITKLSGIGYLTKNILRPIRLIADVTGISPTGAQRIVMAGSMASARITGAMKEARLANEEVIEKTRIGKAKYGESEEEQKQKESDIKRAEDEAWRIYENAKKKSGPDRKVSALELKTAYLHEIPKDLQERLKNTSVANGMVQGVLRKHLDFDVNRLNKDIDKIEKSDKLSPEKIETKKEQLLLRWEKRLTDYDRVLTQTGVVDGFAMATRYAEASSKNITRVMTTQTLYLTLDKIWDSLSHILSSQDIHPIEMGAIPGTRPWIPPRGDLGKLVSYKESFVGSNPASIHNVAQTPSSTFVINNVPTHNFTTEGIKFNHGKGAIQGILELRKQIADQYPDISKAPPGIRAFAEEPSAVKLAKELGLYDPNNLNGKESALISDDAVLKFDEHGDLLFGKPGHISILKHYEGEMRDYDHSGPIYPDRHHNFEKAVKIAENDEMEVENFNTEETLTPPIDTYAQAEEDVREKLEKDYARSPDAPWRRGIYDTDSVGEKIENSNDQSNYGTSRGENVENLTGFSMEQKDALRYNPEFVKNPFHLSEEKLMRALHAMQKDRKFIIGDEDESIWRNLRNMKANNAIKHINTPDDNPAISRLSKYLRVLRSFAGFGPRRFFGVETTEQYIARALQKLEYEGKLENFEASIRR